MISTTYSATCFGIEAFSVEIEVDDTVDSLKQKVQEAEQEIILKAVGLFSEGKIKVKGKKVVIG